jgi:hypothetical protein
MTVVRITAEKGASVTHILLIPAAGLAIVVRGSRGPRSVW